jgi:ADP-ribose pyrophosphatase YjhB (NUDIX family)
MTEEPTIVVGATRDEFRGFRDRREGGGHFTAVSWVVDPDTKSILLVEHATLGWSCPGGHLEPGESALDAAVRELREEVGVHADPVSPDPFAITQSSVCSRPETLGERHWSLGFVFHVSALTPIVAEADQDVAWFRVDELPEPRANDLDIVVDHLLRTLQPGLSVRRGTRGAWPTRGRW